MARRVTEAPRQAATDSRAAGDRLPSRLVRTIHAAWVWVALVTTGAAGLWGLVLAVWKRKPGRAFTVAAWVAGTAMLVQVALGLLTYAGGIRPESEFHLFYGFLVLFAFVGAYVFRAAMARRPALSWGLLLLFVMGLGIRAWTNI